MPQLSQRRAVSVSAKEPGSRRNFIVVLLEAIGLALVAAVLIAPLAALAVSALGFRFPFPRIFDRTVMVTLLVALLLFYRPLGVIDLLRQGFHSPRSNMASAFTGFAIALIAFATLVIIAAVASHWHEATLVFLPGTSSSPYTAVLIVILRNLPAAILIGVLEEGFFRAFLLGGIERGFGSLAAVVLSSVVFAIVHIVRSPARFYLTGFHPAAGMKTLASSASRVLDPGQIPFAIGLFLLSLVLGEVFVLTRRAYCSIGFHTGFVFAAKSSRQTIHSKLPRWLAGRGPVPLLAAPPAWILSAVLLVGLRWWLRPGREGGQ